MYQQRPSSFPALGNVQGGSAARNIGKVGSGSSHVGEPELSLAGDECAERRIDEIALLDGLVGDGEGALVESLIDHGLPFRDSR
jgi:hypothetical protein